MEGYDYKAHENSRSRLKSAAHTALSGDGAYGHSKADIHDEKSRSYIAAKESHHDDHGIADEYPGTQHGSRIQSASIDPLRYLSESQNSKHASRVEDTIIPVLDKSRQKQVIPEFLDDSEYKDVQRNTGTEYTNAEDIDLTRLQFARMLSPFLSMAIVKGIFSKNWNYREQAINAIKNNITPEKKGSVYPLLTTRLNFGDETQLLISIFGALSITIHDKLPQVIQASLMLLEKSIKELKADAKITENPVFKRYASLTQLHRRDHLGANSLFGGPKTLHKGYDSAHFGGDDRALLRWKPDGGLFSLQVVRAAKDRYRPQTSGNFI